ncbi:MAG: regulatory protein RecX [Methylococcaceae bacterium]|nr:regulatory protein RecX [Methylococcaceae bacterium]
MLSYREHSQQELLQKLALKGFSAELIQPVLDALALKDWQSDQRYAECYARQRLQKGYGALRVAYELRQRGIVGLDLDAIVLEVAYDWQTLLEQTYLKKYVHEPFMSRSEWAKRSRFLLQRGFSADKINALFKHLQIKFK